MHAILTIKITYDGNNYKLADSVLDWAANHLATEGLLSDEGGELIVDEWDYTVEVD